MGQASLGTINVSGYAGDDTTVSQSVSASYTFSGGAAVVTFPASTTASFFPGGSTQPEYLYFSPDGNFFFGGSPTDGFDIMVGVRNSGTQNFGGLYYNAGLFQDDSQLSSDIAYFNSYYGSFNATAAGNILQHQRISDSFNSGAYGSTFADTFTPPVPATYTDAIGGEQYAVGANGAIRIGQALWPFIGIDVGLQAPAFSGPSVYLNPTGIVNAASFSPFTAGVSPGEFVTLYGSNLAPGTDIFTGAPFPPNSTAYRFWSTGLPRRFTS